MVHFSPPLTATALADELHRLADDGDVDASRLLARLSGGRAERDRIIREIARRHFRHCVNTNARAVAIGAAFRRYDRCRWQSDRQASSCPYAPTSLDGLMWRALTAGAIPQDRQLWTILSR